MYNNEKIPKYFNKIHVLYIQYTFNLYNGCITDVSLYFGYTLVIQTNMYNTCITMNKTRIFQ